MLKVLHVNYSDIIGGASIGVNRFHQALLKRGVNSKLLVCDKSTSDQNVIGPSSSLELISNQLKISLARFFKRNLMKTKNKETVSFNYFNTKILNKINQQDVDIVHLHWLGNEMISIAQLKKINKPVIWSFWDMWPICGAEHHSYDERFIEGYTKNNRPDHESGLDLNRYVWNYKKKHFNFDYTITTPSLWFYNIVKKSYLHKNKEIKHLPLSLDTIQWAPRDKKNAREIFNVEENKKVLLFGSATSTNERKGFDFLINLFSEKKFDNCKLLIFGDKPRRLDKLNIESKYIGKVKDIHSLSILYSLSDILLIPSKIELFGQIGLEANSCGTPCVTFENTGPTDYVDHLKTGYVAKYLDIEDFSNGINWVLDDRNRYQEISKNCRNHIVKNFDDSVISEKLIEIYNQVKKNN